MHDRACRWILLSVAPGGSYLWAADSTSCTSSINRQGLHFRRIGSLARPSNPSLKDLDVRMRGESCRRECVQPGCHRKTSKCATGCHRTSRRRLGRTSKASSLRCSARARNSSGSSMPGALTSVTSQEIDIAVNEWTDALNARRRIAAGISLARVPLRGIRTHHQRHNYGTVYHPAHNMHGNVMLLP